MSVQGQRDRQDKEEFGIRHDNRTDIILHDYECRMNLAGSRLQVSFHWIKEYLLEFSILDQEANGIIQDQEDMQDYKGSRGQIGINRTKITDGIKTRSTGQTGLGIINRTY
jgi:hypothetical protein